MLQLVAFAALALAARRAERASTASAVGSVRGVHEHGPVCHAGGGERGGGEGGGGEGGGGEGGGGGGGEAKPTPTLGQHAALHWELLPGSEAADPLVFVLFCPGPRAVPFVALATSIVWSWFWN